MNLFDESGYRSQSIWSLKNDDKGVKILLHYLYGKGEPINEIDGSWGKYMKRNKILKEKIQEIVFPLENDLEKKNL